jgi:drug/metabolite transporter (DMT)-like permease
MISVKRTSLVMSVIYGKFLFGEEKIRERIAGSVVMLCGVAFITVF